MQYGSKYDNKWADEFFANTYGYVCEKHWTA